MPFCPKCGADVSEDARFCHDCGAALGEVRVTRPSEEKYEKREKDEKGEKREKGEKHEKRGDRGSPLMGGLVLIWLGITFYLATLRVISWMDWWAYFLLGLGGILLIQAVITAASTGRSGTMYGPLIGGGVLLLIGATWILGIRNWWPLIPIAIGIAIIVSVLRERMRSPRP